jgi:hypothetical protein
MIILPCVIVARQLKQIQISSVLEETSLRLSDIAVYVFVFTVCTIFCTSINVNMEIRTTISFPLLTSKSVGKACTTCNVPCILIDVIEPRLLDEVYIFRDSFLLSSEAFRAG